MSCPVRTNNGSHPSFRSSLTALDSAQPIRATCSGSICSSILDRPNGNSALSKIPLPLGLNEYRVMLF